MTCWTKNWMARGILFGACIIASVISLQYAKVNFKSDRSIILLNRTRPDFHRLLDTEKKIPTGAMKEYLDYFHLVHEAMPSNSDALLMLGYIESLRGHQSQALTFLQQAYHLDPDFFFIQYDLALLYSNSGDEGKGIDLLQKALSAPPQATVSRMSASIIYRQLFASLDTSGDLISDLQHAYQDANLLLMQAVAKQKGVPPPDASRVYPHII